MSAKIFKKQSVALAICLWAPCVWAQTPDEERAVQTLPETTVTADKVEQELGSKQYGREAIAATPHGNGDLGSLLVRHPGVHFDNAALSANTPGDIAPASISINGAKFYQNQFLLDGASINSTISGGVGYGAENDSPAADASLGLSLDTHLLCNITVHDSNVSAAYGRFMGGVIDAEVCAPRKQWGGDVSLQYTSSDWLERKFDGPDNQLSSDVTKQHAFKKWIWRSNFEAQVTDRLGLVGSFSRKASVMPLMAYSNGAQSPADALQKNARHAIDNGYLKAFYDIGGGVKTDVSIMLAPSTSEAFRANVKNSAYRNESGGQALHWGLVMPTAYGIFDHKLAYRATESSRTSDSNQYISWQYSAADKNWAPEPVGGYKANTWVREGGFGDIEQREKNLSYQWNFKFTEQLWAGVQHRLSVGGNLEWDRFTYERPNDYAILMAAHSTAYPTYTTTCGLLSGGVDTSGCSLAPAVGQAGKGQFLNYRSRYQAGTIEHHSQYYALYVEDAMHWDRLKIRAGARLDKASDAQKLSLAPRLSGSYALGAQRNALVFGGLNRYYGQHLKAYQIAAQKASLSLPVERRKLDAATGLIGDWDSKSGPASVVPDNLKTPFVDEFNIGWSQVFGEFAWKFQYLSRNSNDEVTMVKGNAGVWSNDGYTRAKIYTIGVDGLSPLTLAGSKTVLAAAWDYTRSHSSHADWSTSYLSEDFLPEQVIYQGAMMDRHLLPTQNFQRPWTLRLMSSTEIPRWGVKVDTLLRLRKAYQKVAYTKTTKVNGVSYLNYEDRPLGKSINLDVKLTKEWTLPSQNRLYAELMLENLFNRSNQYDFDSTGYYLLEKGRQATLRVGYEF